ncbi:MAG: hypothetical protein AABX37_02130, partial [Nanoarchaeota archaeon]
SFFSQIEGAFVHDCEFREIERRTKEKKQRSPEDHLARETNISPSTIGLIMDSPIDFTTDYPTFCSFFSLEARQSQCRSDFQEGIIKYCASPPLQEKKRYETEIKDNFLNSQKPLPSEKEVEDLALQLCRDRLPPERVGVLFSLKDSSGQQIYSQQRLPDEIIESDQKLKQEEETGYAVCRQITYNQKVEELCRQTPESNQECQRLFRNGRLRKADFVRTLEQYCSDWGNQFRERTLRNLKRGYGKLEERFPTNEAQADDVKANVEGDCYDNFNVESKIERCLLTLPPEVTLDDIAERGITPYFITKPTALWRLEGNSSSSPSWNVDVFIRSTEFPALRLLTSNFSQVSINSPPAVKNQSGVYYFNLVPSADWRSNRVNSYELLMETFNRNGSSAPVKLTVAYDARRKVNPREQFHSNTAVMWELTEAGYASGVRTDTSYTPFPGHDVLSSLQLTFHGEGGVRGVKEYALENASRQELYGEIRGGVGIGYITGFRSYPFLFEVGGGYSESGNLQPTRQWYLALRGNELLGIDFEYNLLFQRKFQRIASGTTGVDSLSLDSLEARVATLLTAPNKGWGLVAGVKMETIPPLVETEPYGSGLFQLSLGVKYRIPNDLMRNIEFELKVIWEERGEIPTWRLKKALEGTKEETAFRTAFGGVGGVFSINFEFP